MLGGGARESEKERYRGVEIIIIMMRNEANCLNNQSAVLSAEKRKGPDPLSRVCSFSAVMLAGVPLWEIFLILCVNNQNCPLPL